MKTIFEHIDTVKGQPHHIRRRVALGTATLVSGLIAVIWLGASLATGAFALHTTSFADATGLQNIVATTTDSGVPSGLAGAAGAFDGASAPAHIQVVEPAAVAPVQNPAQQTVIPF